MSVVFAMGPTRCRMRLFDLGSYRAYNLESELQIRLLLAQQVSTQALLEGLSLGQAYIDLKERKKEAINTVNMGDRQRRGPKS